MKLHTRHWMIAVLIGMLLLVIATLALGGSQRSPRKHEARSFARTIVTQLETAQRAGEFDRAMRECPVGELTG